MARWIERRRRSRPVPPEVASPAPEVAPQRPRWDVGPPTVRSTGDGWSEVVATVDGEEMAFAFDGGPAARPEAFLTYIAPLALAAGADLASEVGVDERWRAGFTEACRRLGPWIDAEGTPVIDTAGPPVPAGVASGRVGLCFTAGVDSFWTLLRSGRPVDDLVYVWGFDVTLDDRSRYDDITASLATIAAEAGLGLRPVRTAARAHHLNPHLLWGFHHGAALAAVGIALSDEIDELVIPPSYPDGGLIPWGSQPDLDPLWSIPGVVEITHASTTQTRYERIIDLADEPLVHQHLRVCWEYLSPGANCGRCEKCVRTMVMFAGAGTLARLETFPSVDDLPAAVAGLAPLPPHSISFWEALVDDRLPPPLRTTVEHLIASSTPTP